MHVEFRFSELSQVSLFDCQSFLRVKELVALQSSATNSCPPETASSTSQQSKKKLLELDSLVKRAHDEKLCRKRVKDYKPQIRIQLVFERLVKLESSNLDVKLERKQHEKQRTTNFDESDIQTKRFSAKPREVILSSLPLVAADCIVKIRLIQLAPDFQDDKLNEVLDGILDPSHSGNHSRTEPICIGVAKITLKELMNIRGGICIALQAKQSLIRLVEQLNLNTVATNAMFGKDIGGSAFLTIQVIHYSFGKIPVSKLLLNPSKSEENSGNAGSENDDNSRTSGKHSSKTKYDTNEEQKLSAQLNSPIVRFTMIPYIAFIDFVIRISDAVSWRSPKKTLVLLLMVMLAMISDFLETIIVVFFLGMLLMTIRTSLSLYHVPPANCGSTPLVSPLTSKSSPHVYLYGRDHALFNALIRARLFFSQGLQKDAFYELALIIHSLRRLQRRIVVAVVAVWLSLFLVSIETLLVLGIFCAFFVYPVTLNFPLCFRKPIKADSSMIRQILKINRANRPMRVARVVQVSVASDREENYMLSDPFSLSRLPSATASNGNQFLDNVKLGTPSSVTPSVISSRTFGFHKRAHTTDFDYKPPSISTERQHQNVSVLSFAVVVFKCETSGSMTGSPTFATSNRSANCGNLVKKLKNHFSQGRQVRDNPGSFPDFFTETLNLLNYIRRQCSMQMFVSPSVLGKKSEGGGVRLDLFVRPAWLAGRGEDDGITTTLLETPNRFLTVEKVPKNEFVSDDARSLALLAAHLLQGSSLSVYCSGPGSIMCSTILPLIQGSDSIDRMPFANPCPQPLFNTLEEIWKGTMVSASAGENPKFNVDTVLSIINTYNDSNKRGYTMNENTPNNNKNGPRQSFLSAFQSAPRQASVPTLHNRTQSGQLPYGALTENRRTTFASPRKDPTVTRGKRDSQEITRRVSQTLPLESEEFEPPVQS